MLLILSFCVAFGHEGFENESFAPVGHVAMKASSRYKVKGKHTAVADKRLRQLLPRSAYIMLPLSMDTLC